MPRDLYRSSEGGRERRRGGVVRGKGVDRGTRDHRCPESPGHVQRRNGYGRDRRGRKGSVKGQEEVSNRVFAEETSRRGLERPTLSKPSQRCHYCCILCCTRPPTGSPFPAHGSTDRRREDVQGRRVNSFECHSFTRFQWSSPSPRDPDVWGLVTPESGTGGCECRWRTGRLEGYVDRDPYSDKRRREDRGATRHSELPWLSQTMYRHGTVVGPRSVRVSLSRSTALEVFSHSQSLVGPTEVEGRSGLGTSG